jgi:ATP-dependent exoDNAse (exonuclease V) beta subunit
LVHRLLQRLGFGSPDDERLAREIVLGMLKPEEIASSADRSPTELADEVLGAYRAICRRPEVRAIYLAGDRLHEVPFTMHLEGVLLRGTIDCIVRDEAGGITLLEFKTGRPRDEHQVQLELYRTAASRLFPGSPIDARLVYATA